MVAEKKSRKGKDSQDSKKNQSGSALTSMAAIPGEETDYGSIRISESVFAALVRKYTLEVEGVARFASGSLMGGLAEMLGRRGPESSIMVKFDGDSVEISVTLVISFGAKIPEVSELVQSVIRNRIEEFTGKHVAKVDVIVQDIEEPEEEQLQPEAGEKGDKSPSRGQARETVEKATSNESKATENRGDV